MEEKAHIITEMVFGSSRKIQFIGLQKVPTNTPTTTNIPSQHTRSIDSNHQSPRSPIYLDKEDNTSSSTSIHNTMSIESLLSIEEENSNYLYPRQSQSASSHEISVTSLLTSDYKRKNMEPSTSTKKHKEIPRFTCLYAAVAQKSYGSEKRFLCPPPVVQFTSTLEQQSERMQVNMSIIHENGEKILEQHSSLDDTQSASFKYLHVTGTAKAKQFRLQIDVLSDTTTPICSFSSDPVAIISKPSKKTAKSRNVSSCILATMPVSLFSRINSQTVRTKYMTSINDMLCAKNNAWSPFDIILIHPPHPPHTQPLYLTYGAEIMLRDVQTGVTSPSLRVRKVDKNRIVPCAYGPVSQMQKIALQHVSSGMYFSASGSAASNGVEYASSRLVYSPFEPSYEQVQDPLCWTIVGIHSVQTELDEPQAPYPLLTHVDYEPSSHTLHVVGQHLIQATPAPRHLELWLGTQGPLKTKVAKAPHPHAPHETHWSVQLPPLQQNELPLILVRQDGLVYQTGKSLVQDNTGSWTCILK